MRRRLLLMAPLAVALKGEGTAVRGRLRAGRKLETSAGVIALEGDAEVAKVLDDERLFGSDVEVEGESAGPGKFRIAGIHTKPVWVHQKGERLGVSYWCDICYIRTYSPGQCWCCQEETRLDPKDPKTPDRKP